MTATGTVPTGLVPVTGMASTTSAAVAGPGNAATSATTATGMPGNATTADANPALIAGKASAESGKSAPSANDIKQLTRQDALSPLPAAANLAVSTNTATGAEPATVPTLGAPIPQNVAMPPAADPFVSAAAGLSTTPPKSAVQPGLAGSAGKSGKATDGTRISGAGPMPAQPVQGLTVPAVSAGGANLPDEGLNAPGQERAATQSKIWGGIADANPALTNAASHNSTKAVLFGQTQSAGTAVPRAETSVQLQIQTPREVALPMQAQLAQTTPLPGSGTDAAQALSAENDAEIATTRIETELNLARAEARASADRSGANLPRFMPHTAAQLAGQISRNFNNGNRTFDIRLDPAELGKVDVRLEMRADNRVHAILTAERPETLAELQRSARDLERALNDAGLELSEEGLSFAMSEDEDPSDAMNEDGGSSLPVFAESGQPGFISEGQTPEGAHSAYGFLLSRRDSVDVRV